MSGRENSVYLAKLAEQAERYEGIPPPPSFPTTFSEVISADVVL